MPSFGSKHLTLENPESITYVIPCTVSDVSAMFVAKITFRAPVAAFRKIRIWHCPRSIHQRHAHTHRGCSRPSDYTK